MSGYLIVQGDARHLPLRDGSVQVCVTSPPYWALRDYGVSGQIGLERTPEEYVRHLVEVFREVWRVLRPDGTLWLNLGSSYAGSGKGPSNSLSPEAAQIGSRNVAQFSNGQAPTEWLPVPEGYKPKDLIPTPWLVAMALQRDGWYLRQDIIWSKPNPMPESVTDRCTRSHEYLFLLSKNRTYYYDAEAIKEPVTGGAHSRGNGLTPKSTDPGQGIKANTSFHAAVNDLVSERNKRSVWEIATESFPGSHFATFPTALVEPCIKAGTSERGCCPICQAPWRRVVEKSGGTLGQSWHNHEADEVRGQRGGDHGHNVAADGWKTYRVEMKGWTPSCACPPHTPIPCTVLDVFSGAGTTALVANRLGRRAIGVELNWDYCQLGRRRIASDAPLLNAVAPLVSPPAQPGLFA